MAFTPQSRPRDPSHSSANQPPKLHQTMQPCHTKPPPVLDLPQQQEHSEKNLCSLDLLNRLPPFNAFKWVFTKSIKKPWHGIWTVLSTTDPCGGGSHPTHRASAATTSLMTDHSSAEMASPGASFRCRYNRRTGRDGWLGVTSCRARGLLTS